MRMLACVRSPLADIGGQVIDLGDLIKVRATLIKGKRPHFVWHIGAPRKTTAADRARPAATSTLFMRYPGADAEMDLKADEMIPLSPKWKDEMGNEATPPTDATVEFTVDDASIINLTDNGDGTATAAATGTLGNATVHGQIDASGRIISGDLLITVVAGDAERFEIIAGEPTEVTPDV